MNRNTGRATGDLEHLRQSIADILTTPIGSRVMRRDYGSLVPALIDQPDNLATQVRLYAAIAGALMRWEPRLSLASMKMARHAEHKGRVDVTLVGSRGHERRAPLTLQLQLNLGAAA